MWQTLITVFIVAFALFFIGKKVYHSIRQAVDPAQNSPCGSGCSCCSVTNCDEKDT